MIDDTHNPILVADGSAKDSIRITRKKAIYVPNIKRAVVRFRRNLVYLFLDDLPLEMTTPAAAKVGYQLCKHEALAEPGEIILLIINRQEFHLLPETARQIGGVMLKKADRADDWQRKLIH